MSEADNKAQRFPAWWVWGIWLLLAGAVVGLRQAQPIDDNAFINLLTAMAGFFAINVLAFWFVFFSGYSRRLRFGSAALVLGVIVALGVVYEVEDVSGEMVPTFRNRFAPKADELLESPVAGSSEGADLSTTTDHDFSQFLGPDRLARYDVVELDTDWQSQAPQELWRQPIGAGWSAFSIVNGYAVTMEQRGGEELVTCYEVQTGELVWSHSTPTRHSTILGGIGPRSTPSIADGRVYSQGATGRVLCLDGATGEEIWSDDLLERYGVGSPSDDLGGIAWGRSGSPLVVDDLLVVPAGGPKGGPHRSLVAYDRESGSLAWEAGDRQVSYSSPVIADLCAVRQIVSVNQDNVSGHDPATGEVLWQHDWPGNSAAQANTSNPVVLPGDRVLVSKAYGSGSMMLQLTKSDDGKFNTDEIWKEERTLKTKFTNVVVRGDYLYGLSDGILECVAAVDGARQWKRGRYYHGQVLGVGDTLLVQAEKGEVVLVGADPEGRGRSLAKLPALNGKTWNNPSLYGKLLLLRNAEEACCYELPLVGQTSTGQDNGSSDE